MDYSYRNYYKTMTFDAYVLTKKFQMFNFKSLTCIEILKLFDWLEKLLFQKINWNTKNVIFSLKSFI